MTVINQAGNTLTGASGSGNFTGVNTPTLITPILGVATATSINFGVDALGNYNKRTAWTPVFTFATPGDLSLSATSTTAWYQRVGDVVTVTCDYTFTATFTTASGLAIVGGLPIAAYSSQGTIRIAAAFGNNVIYPAGTTSLFANMASSSSNITFSGSGSVAGSALSSTNFTTATSNTLRFVAQYFVN